MKSCAMLHGSFLDCNLPTIGQSGFPLSQIVQWSTSATRPDDGEDLEPEVKEAVKFLEMCLDLNPQKRISAKQALASDFLADDFSDTEPEEMDVL